MYMSAYSYSRYVCLVVKEIDTFDPKSPCKLLAYSPGLLPKHTCIDNTVLSLRSLVGPEKMVFYKTGGLK